MPTRSMNIGRSVPLDAPFLRVGLLLLAFALGLLVALQGWHRPLTDFAAALIDRPGFALNALLRRGDLPDLRVDMAFADYQILVGGRARALDVGVHLSSGNSGVPATVSLGDEEISVDVELAPGWSSDFEGERWPLRLVAEEGNSLLGMERARLVPAEDEEALLTWGYLKALREAGYLVPEYALVHLNLNGRALGLYALEELPDAGNMTDIDCIAYADAGPFLAAYAGEHGQETGPGSVVGPASAYARIRVTPALGLPEDELDRRLAADPALAAACVDAEGLLRYEESSPSLSAAALVDPARMGRFLALTTLWRGQLPSVEVAGAFRLAYDADTRRFTPLAAGLPAADEGGIFASLLTDPSIGRAYVRELEILSEGAPLATLEAASREQWEPLYMALADELGYPPRPEELLIEHQTWIKSLLAPAQPLFAEVAVVEESLVVGLGNLQPFPLEILALDLGESARLPSRPEWRVEAPPVFADLEEAVVLPALSESRPIYAHLRVPLDALPAEPGEIRVVVQIWGLEEGQELLVATQESVPPAVSLPEEAP